MFTKKHFEAVAQVLKSYHDQNGYRDYTGGAEVDAMIDQMVGDFGDIFEDNNPNFDRTKFLIACGYGS